jgi:thiosulfate dehydrogenase [quinone] large subunit
VRHRSLSALFVILGSDAAYPARVTVRSPYVQEASRMTNVETADNVPTTAKTVTMDANGAIRLPLLAADVLALLRVTLGLIYLWGFIAQAFGITYTNSTTDSAGHVSYGWHFSFDSANGWISSGFSHSPTGAYVDKTHGPLAFIPQNLPTGLDDVGWMFAIGGLGVALTIGIFMNIAGVGGFVLNVLLWFSTFPPSSNPVIDGTHTIYALLLVGLMALHAGNRWGLGRWWRAHTPRVLN